MTITDEQVEAILVATLEETPKDATHWSRASMAGKSGLSPSTVGRIWKAFRLKPHLSDGFKVSTDPLFIEKVDDVAGLYLNPPEHAVVLCADEKSQIQAPGRSSPVLPIMPGMPEKRTHDYVRYGTTTLFAALDTATGLVISELHRQHRAIEWRKFLQKIDRTVPAGIDVHIVADNYATRKTPMIQKWLTEHPRVHMHFTPTSSPWLNQVERWFAELTARMLRRGAHRSMQALETDIRAWIDIWNENPKPFVWTKTADENPRIPRQTSAKKLRCGTLEERGGSLKQKGSQSRTHAANLELTVESFAGGDRGLLEFGL